MQQLRLPIALLGAAAASTVFLPGQGAVQPIDLTPSGQLGGGHCSRVAVSADARWIVFSSTGDDLVAGDTNQRADVFLRDRATGNVQRISVSDAGMQGDGDSYAGDVSDDGRFVCFCSAAGNLVPGDQNGIVDVFVRDRVLGTTLRVSVASTGQEADGASPRAVLDGQGTTVAFESNASNLVGGDTNGFSDVFVHTLASGAVARVSIGAGGSQANAPCFEPDLSADGQVVVFHSVADNLVAGDGNQATDVFWHDRGSGTTARVSIATGGLEANGDSQLASCSADGQRVAFFSAASNLVAGDGNAAPDVFVHDRQLGATERASVSSSGQEGQGFVGNVLTRPAIDASGTRVVFATRLSGLVQAATAPWEHVYVRDLVAAATLLVSRSSTGAPANSGAALLAYAGNVVGRNLAIATHPPLAVFDCAATNLWPGDADTANDIFAVDVGLRVAPAGPALLGGAAVVQLQAPSYPAQVFVSAWSHSVASGQMLPGLQWLPLDPDSLFAASLAVGATDGIGAASWSVPIPAQPGLVGVSLQSACVMLDFVGPTLFPAISNVAGFVVQ